MGFDKLWADLNGRPVLAWSLNAFARCPRVSALVVVVAPAAREQTVGLLERMGVKADVVEGGLRRRDSVRAGLEVASTEWVVVHDAARPALTPDLIEEGLEAAKETGAAIAAVRETNTVKRVVEGRVEATLDRASLWSAQTPQVFRRELLLEGHRRSDLEATDDAALVEMLGVTVKVYEGAYANIKVTTPVDLQLAALLLASPERNDSLGARPGAEPQFRSEASPD
jgi:2-C-methyl-D-erythritol 4-phosphate cytidylyltransferase